MKPQKRFHSGKANLSLLRKNTQTKRGARPINRLNERESGKPAAPPPLLPTEGPFPTPTAQRCARTAKTAIRAQQRTGTNKKAASQTGNGFFSPSTDVLETMCPAPKQEIKSQKKPRYALKKRLTEERPRKGTPSGAFSPAFLNHTVERSSPVAGKESDSRGGRWEVQLRAGGR